MKKITAIAISLFFIAGCARVGIPGRYSRTVTLMDTFVQVKVIAPGSSRGEIESAVNGAFDLARKLDKKFSTYDPESEVNKLNIAKSLKVSPELFNLVLAANRVSLATGGEFDITIAPVMKANGLYRGMPGEILEKIPDDFSGVGWKNVKLRMDQGKILLLNNAWIDLSGIAKGYIVDSMAEFFKQKGFTSFMINAGGDIYCGTKGDDGPWRIGIRKPGARNIVLTLDVKNMAVATSGDYENVVLDRKTGEVVSHIIDPLKDKAIPKDATSVTVIAPTCSKADGLATGMLAMGLDKALVLADDLGNVEIITVYCPGDKHTIRFSSGAREYVVAR
ncbi:FAD:protein FMN transferase [Candidatus Omnitrophota bacterium]